MSSQSATNTTSSPQNITVDDGVNKSSVAGKIMKMNSLEYPNYMQITNTGLGLVNMPVKCQNLNFTEVSSFTGTNGQPGLNSTNVVKIATFNFVTSQVSDQFFIGNSTICEDGFGNTCDLDLNAVPLNKYDQKTTVTSANNCVSSFPTKSTTALQNSQDQHSGLSTNSENNVDLSFNSLSTFEGAKKQKRVPYPTLRKLYQLQATVVALTTTSDYFAVSPQDFITQEYPEDPAQPTRQVN